ncbi:MAG: flgE 2 [Firmicutes bacterium]|nr:flgE 2 [Bacillota bacterium]
MRSLYSGVSGLRNHQTMMDVIGNNIANVNTIGFKSSSVSFKDVMSQTLENATAGNGSQGGTNPVQVGLGMGVACINTIFSDGSLQPTGKATDLAIQGQGLFVLDSGNNSFLYTRNGNFDFDKQGKLLSADGKQVVGWIGNPVTGTDPDSNTQVMGITVDLSGIGGFATTSIEYANNLSAGATVGNTAESAITVYDSNGTEHRVSGTFTKLASPGATAPATATSAWTFTPSATTEDGLPVTAGIYEVDFDSNGKYVAPSATYPAFTFTPVTGGALVSIVPDFSKITQYGGDTTVVANTQNGLAAGELQGTTIDSTGMVIGRYSNGLTRNLAQISIAMFPNVGGLTKIGDSMYIASSNSGNATMYVPGAQGSGTLNAGSLEMSNVDLAQEFSNMIITQRGFQANSKIISTTDEMLQELANLKR